jgi:hypothetical protein
MFCSKTNARVNRREINPIAQTSSMKEIYSSEGAEVIAVMEYQILLRYRVINLSIKAKSP